MTSRADRDNVVDAGMGSPSVAIDFASNWEIRGGVWRYGIELTRALVDLLGRDRVTIPVYDRLSAPLFEELLATGAAINSRPLASRFDRLESMGRQNGRIIPWKRLLPMVYGPRLRERLFRSALGDAPLYHALFWCRGTPRHGVTVGTVHDMIPSIYYPTATVGAEWIERLLDGHRRYAELIIVPSKATRDDLVEHGNFAAERIRVVHHGIDQQRFSAGPPLSPAQLTEHGLIDQQYLLYVSAFAPHKNVDRMVEAYLRAVGDRRDLPLILVGSMRTPSPALRTHLTDGTGRVRHIGYVPDEALPGLYRGAKALVHVALAEGFGFSPLEAMACGCPVVVSRGGASGEVVGDAGIQVDPRDTDDIARGIRRVLDEPGLLGALREHGLRHVRQYTWKECARATSDVYREAIERGAARR